MPTIHQIAKQAGRNARMDNRAAERFARKYPGYRLTCGTDFQTARDELRSLLGVA